MTLLLLQMAVVLLTALVCGTLARALGQARVVGEIIGGILLGPSVFGRLAPHASAALFPAPSLATLDVLSSLGLILYLFLIGVELDLAQLRDRRASAILTSAASVAVPFAFAAAIAPAMRARFAPPGTAPLPFLLFLGISLSITAFPVLARILEERRLLATPLGATALVAAAIGDVVAWMLLAVALTLIPHAGEPQSLLVRLLWLAGYLLLMFAVVRPLAAALARRADLAPDLNYARLGITLAYVLVSAAATDTIGVHPLFGAFLAGACFPRIPQWQVALRIRLDVVVSVLLLPLFFALTGMRTRLDLLTGPRIWQWAALVLAVAVAGKVGAALLTARTAGQPWRDSLALGALLNTRGLVELVVLSIAFNAGIFSPTLFTLLVLMALVTTMMTTPLLNLLGIRDGVPPAVRPC